MLLYIAEVKKRGERAIGEFRKKLKIPESEIGNRKNICKQKNT